MDIQTRQLLEEAGINVTAGLDRFMGNEALLQRFLKKFPDDANYEKLLAAAKAGDREAALTASHTLKGVCGNLSFDGLFELLTRQVAALRAGNWEEAVALLDEISPAYRRITEAIQRI